MLSIGAFSQLTGLSVKALRYYHAKELLVPSEVDAYSRARRYSLGQLATARWLAALRRAGLSIESTKQAIQSPDLAERIVSEHRQVLELRRAEEDAALVEIGALLGQSPEVGIRPVPAVEALHRRLVTSDGAEPTSHGLQREVDSAVSQLTDLATAQGLLTVGPSWLMWADDEGGQGITVVLPVENDADTQASIDTDGLDLLRLPAGHERYVRIPRAGGTTAFARAVTELLEPDEESAPVDPATLRQVEVDDVLEIAVRLDAGQQHEKQG